MTEARTKAAWSPAARRKRKATIAAKRAGGLGALRFRGPPEKKNGTPPSIEHLKLYEEKNTSYYEALLQELREEQRRFHADFYAAIMWMVRK